MLARYEKLDEFIDAVNNGHEKNSEQPVYVSVMRSQDENNILSFQIFIQVIENNIAVTYCYTDLPSIKVVDPVLFISAFGNNETSRNATKKYESDMLNTTNVVLEEKTKIINKFKELGFTKFVNAIIQ